MKTETHAAKLKQDVVPVQREVGGSPLDAVKPGSESRHVDLPHDFGARVDDTVEVQYASAGVKNQDPGHLQTRSNDEGGGVRQAGAGTSGQGPGAGSGGDIDTDFVGLGGRGIAASIPDKAEQSADGPDRTDGSASAFASGKPGKGENQSQSDVGISNDIPRGGTVTVEKDSENDELDVEGADAIRTSDANDPYADATAGEISRGESAGPADSSSSSAKR